jgi:hypothetical protein
MEYRCSFCGATQYEVAKLIAGKRTAAGAGGAHYYFVCDQCVVGANRLPRTQATTDDEGRPRGCSFCDKLAGEGGVLHQAVATGSPAGHPLIDDECLTLFREILEVEMNPTRQPGVSR